MSVSITHCGDLHIGAQQSTLGNRAPERRAELLYSLSRICDLCEENKTELLLIAGDLFDSPVIDPAVREQVKGIFGGLSRTQVFIVPGNHDYFSDGTVFDFDFGENVHIFRTSTVFETENARIHGIPFLSPYNDSVVLPHAERNDGKAEILLLHADLSGGRYNPITPAQLAATEMDYIALGHVHKSEGVFTVGNTHYAYCGCPEPLGFDELGERGIYMGTVGNHKTELEFYKTCMREYREIYADISSAESLSDVTDIAKSALTDNENNFIKLIFTGESDISVDAEYIKSLLEDSVYFLRVKDTTRPKINLELLRKEQTLRGCFTDIMLRRAEGENTAQTMQALYFGLAAFEGREADLGDN